MTTDVQRLAIEMQAKVETYIVDINRAKLATTDFQKEAVASFRAIEKTSTHTFTSIKSRASDLDKAANRLAAALKSLSRESTVNGKAASKVEQQYKNLKKSAEGLRGQIKKLTLTNKDQSIVNKDLRFKISQLNKQLAEYKKSVRESGKATADFNKQLKSLEKTVSAMAAKTDKLESELVGLKGKLQDTGKPAFKLNKIMAALVATLSIDAVTTFSDSISMANSQLRSVTKSAEEFNEIQARLNGIALDSRQNINELTSVYARFSRAGQDAGFTQEQVLGLTERLTKAFKIEGNTTAEVNSALLQLTQSFRSGQIMGEEFRSLSESSTLVLKALAKQLNVTTGDLKKMSSQGLVTPKDLLGGLEQMDSEIRSQFATVAPTFADVGTQAGNTFRIAWRESGLDKLADDLTTSLNKSFQAISFGMSKNGKRLTALYETQQKIGVKAAAQVEELARLIGQIQSQMTEDISTEQLKKMELQIDSLNKQIITTMRSSESYFDKFLRGAGSGSIKFAKDSLVALTAEVAKNKAAMEQQAPPAPLQDFVPANARGNVEAGLARLELMREMGNKEIEIQRQVQNKLITEREARAMLAFERDKQRMQTAFENTLKAAKVNEGTLLKIEEKAQENHITSLSEGEVKLLELAQGFHQSKIDSEIAFNQVMAAIQMEEMKKEVERENKKQEKIKKAANKKRTKEAEIVDNETGRLEVLRAEAAAELVILQQLDNDKRTQAEINATAAHEDTLNRMSNNFEETLEKLGTNQEAIRELQTQFDSGEIEMLSGKQMAMLELISTFDDARLSMVKAFEAKKNDIIKKAEKKNAKTTETARQHEYSSTLSAAVRLSNAVASVSEKGSEAHKAAAIVSIGASTAAGMMRQYADLPYFAALATKAAIFVEGAAALSSIGGSGGGSLPPESSVTPTQEEQEQQQFVSQDVSVSAFDEGGSRFNREQIEFSPDTGTTIEDAMVTVIQELKRRGAI